MKINLPDIPKLVSENSETFKKNKFRSGNGSSIQLHVTENLDKFHNFKNIFGDFTHFFCNFEIRLLKSIVNFI